MLANMVDGRPKTRGDLRPILIIVRPSLISQWEAEKKRVKLGDQPRASWLVSEGDVPHKTHKTRTEIWSYLQCKNQKAE